MNYTIGKLARAACVNVETVRYYERKGLIQQPGKPPGGFRKYPQAALDRIRFIKRAKELGFTLEEIKQLLSLDDAPCGQVRALAENKLAAVQTRIVDLQRLAGVLEDLLAKCHTNPDDTHCPIIETLQPGPE